MIKLSKVFPTLDCAGCITTPKMAAAAHHENIHLYTSSELQNLSKGNARFEALIRKKPRYVKEDQCIGCRQCKDQCPVYVSDPEQEDFVAKKAISIPFSNAIPQVPCLDDQVCMLCGRCAQVCPKDAVDGFLKTPHLQIDPTLSKTQGLFVAGTASGPKDIPDTVSEAGAAAMKASSYLESLNPAFQ